MPLPIWHRDTISSQPHSKRHSERFSQACGYTAMVMGQFLASQPITRIQPSSMPPILRLWVEVQLAAWLPVEHGFYYVVDLPHRISPEDFPKIEEEMKKEIKAHHTFERVVVPREQAVKDAQNGRLGALNERPGNPS